MVGKKDKFFQSICPASPCTAAYRQIRSISVFSLAANSIQSSTELSRDKFQKCTLGISNTKVFKVLNRLSQPVLIPTLLLSQSVVELV